jgi:hypothetical protein
LGQPTNPRQPDWTAGTFVWQPPSDAAPQWLRITLGADFTPRLFAGAAVHVVFEPHTGPFDANNQLELYSVRSRFPLQFTFRTQADGSRLQDDFNSFMYTPDSAAAASPYCAQKSGNASFHPIAVVECSRGEHFGNPYDVHSEELIFGANRFSMLVRTPTDVSATFVAMFLRGAGIAGSGGVPGLPNDACYLSVFARRKGSGVSTLVHGPTALVELGDRLFKSRSHWFGRWMDAPFKLASADAAEYIFELSSPGCALVTPNDAYLFSYDSSSLTALAVGYAFGRVQRGGIDVSPTAVSGLVVRDDHPARTSLAWIDELTGSISAPPAHASNVFPLAANAGDTLQFRVLVRNITNLPAALGGELWSEVRDADSGAVLSAARLHAELGGHDENGLVHSLDMPAADLHLEVRCGHVQPAGAGLGGLLVLDDRVPLEVRVF